MSIRSECLMGLELRSALNIYRAAPLHETNSPLRARGRKRFEDVEEKLNLER